MLAAGGCNRDLVFQVHCKGSFAPAHFAGNYWRDQSKADGKPQDGRIILTSSIVGLEGNYGQSNYAAAKAANAMFGMTLALEMERYGVTVNVVCPSGLTRMTEDLAPDAFSEEQQARKEKQQVAHRTNEYVAGSPNNVAPLVSTAHQCCWWNFLSVRLCVPLPQYHTHAHVHTHIRSDNADQIFVSTVRCCSAMLCVARVCTRAVCGRAWAQVAWLCSPDGAGVTGRVFVSTAFNNGWAMGESFTLNPTAPITKDGENWSHEEAVREPRGMQCASHVASCENVPILLVAA